MMTWRPTKTSGDWLLHSSSTHHHHPTPRLGLIFTALVFFSFSETMMKAFGSGSRGLIVISGIPEFLAAKQVGCGVCLFLRARMAYKEGRNGAPTAFCLTDRLSVLPSTLPSFVQGIPSQVPHHRPPSAK
jgi:hypothetical protein